MTNDTKRSKTKQLKTPPPQSNSAVINLPSVPPHKSTELISAYRSWTYSAVNRIATDVSQIDLVLNKSIMVDSKMEVQAVEEHPVLSLLQYVNEFSTFQMWVEIVQIYLDLMGEAYTVVLKQNGRPAQLWVLRPDWVNIIPDEQDFIKGYEYRPPTMGKGIFIPKEDVIPMKYSHPKNPYRGYSPTRAGAMALDINEFASEYQRTFFFNGAVPSLIFSTDKKIKDDQIDRFKKQWESAYMGASKAHKIAFLGGGFNVTELSGQKEGDFIQLRDKVRDEILAMYGLSKAVLGIVDDVNRSNGLEQRRTYYQNVITPRMKRFVGYLNEYLLPMYTGTTDSALFFDFVDPTPEDKELKLKFYESGLTQGWLSVNEVREEEGYPPVEGGDEIRPPFNPFSGNNTPPSGDDEDENKQIARMVLSTKGLKKQRKLNTKPPTKTLKAWKDKEIVDKIKKTVDDIKPDLIKVINHTLGKNNEAGLTQEQKDKYWEGMVVKATPKEEQFTQTLRGLMNQQKDVVLEGLEQIKFFKVAIRKDKTAEVLARFSETIKLWFPQLEPLIIAIIAERGATVLLELGISDRDLNMTEAEIVNYMATQGAEFIKLVNQTTKEALRETIAEGLSLSESIRQIQKRIEVVYTDATGSRAELIARTEVWRATNFATLQGYKQSGVVTAKQWLTSKDERVCPYCNELDDTVLPLDSDYFQTGDVFTVDGKSLSISFDVQGGNLHPNCRCTIVPITESLPEVFLRDAQTKAERQAKLKAEQEALEEQKKKLIKEAENKAKEILTKAEQDASSIKETAENLKKEKIKEGENEKLKIVKDLIELKNETLKELDE